MSKSKSTVDLEVEGSKDNTVTTSEHPDSAKTEAASGDSESHAAVGNDQVVVEEKKDVAVSSSSWKSFPKGESVSDLEKRHVEEYRTLLAELNAEEIGDEKDEQERVNLYAQRQEKFNTLLMRHVQELLALQARRRELDIDPNEDQKTREARLRREKLCRNRPLTKEEGVQQSRQGERHKLQRQEFRLSNQKFEKKDCSESDGASQEKFDYERISMISMRSGTQSMSSMRPSGGFLDSYPLRRLPSDRRQLLRVEQSRYFDLTSSDPLQRKKALKSATLDGRGGNDIQLVSTPEIEQWRAGLRQRFLESIDGVSKAAGAESDAEAFV